LGTTSYIWVCTHYFWGYKKQYLLIYSQLMTGICTRRESATGISSPRISCCARARRWRRWSRSRTLACRSSWTERRLWRRSVARPTIWRPRCSDQMATASTPIRSTTGAWVSFFTLCSAGFRRLPIIIWTTRSGMVRGFFEVFLCSVKRFFSKITKVAWSIVFI